MPATMHATRRTGLPPGLVRAEARTIRARRRRGQTTRRAAASSAAAVRPEPGPAARAGRAGRPACARPRAAPRTRSRRRAPSTPVGKRPQKRRIATGKRHDRRRLDAVATTQAVGNIECREAPPAGAAPTSGSTAVSLRGPGAMTIDGVLRHPPVRRQLAADDGDHPGARILDDGVAPAQVTGALAAGSQQRSQSRVRADHVADGRAAPRALATVRRADSAPLPASPPVALRAVRRTARR